MRKELLKLKKDLKRELQACLLAEKRGKMTKIIQYLRLNNIFLTKEVLSYINYELKANRRG